MVQNIVSVTFSQLREVREPFFAGAKACDPQGVIIFAPIGQSTTNRRSLKYNSSRRKARNISPDEVH